MESNVTLTKMSFTLRPIFTKFYKAHNIMAKSKNKIKIIASIHVFVS